ncbi:MAG: dTDP-glucose 4,6-dehydratase [Paenibacillaceae bacterium]|jgi:dTDP-glucose 4,6-dehydratase|nr:dTDP-glucose 4,6-dehydratase [Paenibacillaceae bacterium]
MKILVTGGAGFIGSNYIRYRLKKHPGAKVVNLDALTYAGNPENVQELEADQRYSFVQGDIADSPFIMELFAKEGFDAVVNFAAESHVDRSIADPGIFIRTNVAGTQTLLEAARRTGIKRFVQVSTDEVYGSLGAQGLFTEETPLAPNSPYSASKAGADLLVRAYCETFGLNASITRCSNNYGPYQFPEKLIPLMISNALRDDPVPVYGDGLNIRDWLHVEDHCAAVDLVLERGAAGEVYNIGGNNEHRNIDIVRTVLRMLGKPETLIRHVPDRLGHDRRYAIDAAKITRELGWTPSYTFDEGIVMTIKWYLEHGEWLENILRRHGGGGNK